MKKIKLTKGKFALVDDKDFQWLNQWKWHCFVGYAFRRIYNENWRTGSKLKGMHRVILKPKKGFEIDHINGNRLDNRRSNLRIVNRSQNNMNKNKQRNNTSGFKGVFWRKDRNKWRVKVGTIHAGLFKSKIEAAKAYDQKAKELFGEFAKLNFK